MVRLAGVGLSRKLQIKPGSSVAVLGVPPNIRLDLTADVTLSADPSNAEAVLAFATTAGDLDGVATPALSAAREDRVAWIAYPKAGQLGTDLNRDRLAAAARQRGAQPVRQISIDDVWSALRFRPG